jgi:beta-lactamase superfamily II metal-dependent hydrolase
MNLTFYQSECGDAAKVSFIGNDGKQHHIFIDGGYERTFRNSIRSDVEKIMAQEEVIDCWIVTHIHDDHIGGVKKYIDYIKSGEMKDIVSSWIYNAPRFENYPQSLRSDVSVAKSIGQGDMVYDYLVSKGKVSAFDFTNETKSIDFHGLKIIFLTPTKEKLADLRELYNINDMRPFQNKEDDKVSDAVAATQHDYSKKVSEFNINDFKEDTNVENGSSISFIIEYNGKRILWLSDAHPSDVANTLSNSEHKYSTVNKLGCKWVKVTHHGSKANNKNELYDLIECENYLISANGENKHMLPNKEALVRILKNSFRDQTVKYKMYYTYDNTTLKNIFAVDGGKVFEQYNFETIYLNDKINCFNI